MSTRINSDEVEIGRHSPDPDYPTLDIVVAVNRYGHVIVRDGSKTLIIPNHIAEELSSDIYLGWERSDDVIAAFKSEEQAKAAAEQARADRLKLIQRGEA